MSDGEGLPLQLTTITVAVPGSPLSPSSSMLSSMVAGQVAGSDCTATVKWKYEQPKSDKVGTTLVRIETSSTSPLTGSVPEWGSVVCVCVCGGGVTKSSVMM